MKVGAGIANCLTQFTAVNNEMVAQMKLHIHTYVAMYLYLVMLLCCVFEPHFFALYALVRVCVLPSAFALSH